MRNSALVTPSSCCKTLSLSSPAPHPSTCLPECPGASSAPEHLLSCVSTLECWGGGGWEEEISTPSLRIIPKLIKFSEKVSRFHRVSRFVRVCFGHLRLQTCAQTPPLGSSFSGQSKSFLPGLSGQQLSREVSAVT